jgi:hypothetical protein
MFLLVRSCPRICSKALKKNASFPWIFALLGILSITTWAWSFGGDSEPGGSANGMSASKNRENLFDYYSHLGVVSKQSDSICLTINNSAPTPGTQVSLVALSAPQMIAQAEVLKANSVNCTKTDANDADSNRYELRMLHGEPRFSFPAVAILNGAHPLTIARGLASADLDGDGHREYFRECTSSEGVHLSAWTGKPLVGKRRWHKYYYLGYDVEPNCTNKDTE